MPLRPFIRRVVGNIVEEQRAEAEKKSKEERQALGQIDPSLVSQAIIDAIRKARRQNRRRAGARYGGTLMSDVEEVRTKRKTLLGR